MDNSFITKDQNTRSGVRKVSSTGEKKKNKMGKLGYYMKKNPLMLSTRLVQIYQRPCY